MTESRTRLAPALGALDALKAVAFDLIPEPAATTTAENPMALS